MTGRQGRHLLGAALLVAVAIWVSQVATFLLNLVAAPALGPTSADTISATLKAANTMGIETPRSRAIGAAKIAGR